ncbi:MAG: S-layer homology domain-containing protein [Clostridia bacterium]|nr:S-layer homology domain-containing protein [Clostridia bacterium]
MMSITKRSRILAVALVVAMIMSLVPMMTAAAGTKYVGIATISYATDSGNSMVTYTIEAPYFNADGSDATGSVNVKVSCPSDSMFYYNTITAVGGKLTFTVAMASGDPIEKYTVEYLSDDLAVPATAVYYFGGNNTDHTAEITHFDTQLAGKTTADVEVWEKAAVTPAAKITNKYLIANTNDYTLKYVTDAINKVKTDAVPYSAVTFANDIDKSAIAGLFNAVDSATPNYNALIFALLQDTDIEAALKAADTDANAAYAKLATVIAQPGKQTKFMTEFLSDGFGTFTSIADVADKFSSAVTEATKTTVTPPNTTTITGGGGDSGYKPPVNPVITVENVFTDINTQEYWWLLEPLQALYQNGFINGRTANTFAPGENITRAEFLKILLLELNMVDKDAKANFADVSENDWFYSYVASGAKDGIVKGMDANTFAPNALITRQEICVMTMRAVRAKAIKLGVTSTDATFTDQQQIADWAVSDVLSLRQAGIISGRDTGAFDPNASATRAEAVKILYGVYVKR